MIKSANFKSLLILSFLASSLILRSQDLFNYSNSKAFADYLYQTGNFEQATQEYHRVVFMSPQDTSSWVRLIQTYHQTRNYSISLRYIDSAKLVLKKPGAIFEKLAAYSLIKTNDFDELDFQLKKNKLEQEDKLFLKASSEVLKGNWEYFNDHKPMSESSYMKDIFAMAKEAKSNKPKSRFLAGALSAIIPGTGKMYSNKTKDGLFSLILVGVTTWQAYRFIDQKGINNIGSVLFGGFAFGLYSGNIYGSVKAARDHNDRFNEKNHEKTDKLVDLYFGY